MAEPNSSVLMVCTANICRSPMAEALWRAAAGTAAGTRAAAPVAVMSAGLDAQPGLPADATCVQLLAARGLSLQEHRSARVNLALAARHELILVMEPVHLQRIKAAAPALAGRVYLLGHWTVGMIADPHGGRLEDYEHCLALIEESVGRWLQRL